MIYELYLKNKNYSDFCTHIGTTTRLIEAEDLRIELLSKYDSDYFIDIQELFDKPKRRYKMKKEIDFKMTLQGFNERCMPNGQNSAEFDVRPNDIATKDGVSWNIETIDNEVYFYKVG